jgi:3beta-hydroxy-delta5-steroid dehydrogenase/steroid delta-isomerase
VGFDVALPASLAGPEGGESEASELGDCLVTGAAGYLGRHLCFELIRRGHTVRAFDCQPIDFSHERIDAVQGDLRVLGDLRKACEGIDTVFHTAALLDFARFATRAQRQRSYAVNVLGVANLVRAAREAGVHRLVHTSSNNVTLDAPVINGDETLPYAARTRDLYTETKIQGEKIALAANGEGGLLTCALRPGGIYGPGEHLLLPRLVAECAQGRYVATIGDGNALSDNVFIDNLVDAQIEAARHLVPEGPLGGQAYFVSDGAPINYFGFFRPIIEALGFRHPRWRVPGALMHAVATAWEFLHWAVRIPRPMLLPLEVRKITVSHYNRIDKARRDFGWTPVVSPGEAMERCIEYCRELFDQREVLDRAHGSGGWRPRPGGRSRAFPR